MRKWKAVLNKESITENSSICENHFHQWDIIRCDETVMPDGTVHQIERTRPRLQANAVPIRKDDHLEMKKEIVELYVEPVSYMNCNFNAKKVLVQSPTITLHEQDDISEASQFPSSNTTANNTENEWNFGHLLNSYRTLQLPNCEWAATASMTGKFITFLRVQNNILKRVQIHDDLAVEVLIADVSVKPKGICTLPKCENDIVDLIKLVDNLQICNNVKEASRLYIFFLNF